MCKTEPGDTEYPAKMSNLKTTITQNMPLPHTEFYDTMDAMLIVVGKEKIFSFSTFSRLSLHQFPIT